MNRKDRVVKIRREEMESILNLKSLVDHKETLWQHAEKYQALGWALQAVNPQDGTNLKMDSGKNLETWVNRLSKPGLSGPKMSLGVLSGKRSQLMVLEVARGRGESILDQYGEWRATSVPPSWELAGNSIFMPGIPHPCSSRVPARRPLESGGSGKARWCRCRLPLMPKCRKPGGGCVLPGRKRPNTPARLC